jgi:hypothetical protein
VKGAIDFAKRKTGRTKHMLAVTYFAAVLLAEKEHLLHAKLDWTRLYRDKNMYRHIRKREMEAIVSRCIAGEEYDLPECPIVIANDK